MKRSVNFTKETEKDLKRLAVLMGIRKTHGEIPKTIRFGVTLAIRALEKAAKTTPPLSAPELRYYFNSVVVLHKEAEALKRAKNAEYEALNSPQPKPFGG